MSIEWVEVFITYDSTEAEMVKGLLEGARIPVVLKSSKVAPYPVNIGKMGEIKILVREGDKELAEKLINYPAKDNQLS